MQKIRDYEAMAKLDLSEEERRSVERDADMLIASFQQMESIDTSETEPLVTVLDVQNVLREDIARQMVSREELLASAPEQRDGYFQVPKTLD